MWHTHSEAMKTLRKRRMVRIDYVRQREYSPMLNHFNSVCSSLMLDGSQPSQLIIAKYGAVYPRRFQGVVDAARR
jgi:hypothetical protein